MSGSKKKSDKIEVSYWEKPSGKNESLKLPRDKANAILEYWRNSTKKTGMANESTGSIQSEDDVVVEKSFKVEEKSKLKKRVLRPVKSEKASGKTEENTKSLSPKKLVKSSPKKKSGNNLSTKYDEPVEVASPSGVDELVVKKSPKKKSGKVLFNKDEELVEDSDPSGVDELMVKKSAKTSLKKLPKQNEVENGHSVKEAELMDVSLEKPIKTSPKKSKSISESKDGTKEATTTHKVAAGTKRKIHQCFENTQPNKKIAYLSDIATSSATDVQDSLHTFSLTAIDSVKWKKITKQDLDLDYGIVFEKSIADQIFQHLEKQTEYYSGDLAKIRVFGKWHNIPRKQVAYGDNGLSYKFSGNTLPARLWTPFLSSIRSIVEKLTGFPFNFVLINRYKDGSDTIGEHRDDEKDLVANHPIASLSLGQQRDFVLRHSLARKKSTDVPIPPSLTIPLEHGSLLVMNPPTNTHWYHSLPVRKSARQPRLNLTFRHMVVKQ
uniref:DNA oxidative demethylase ALKBH2 n=1 Tax=Strigamia maritima TaxID=126957 RepID=T1IXF6_STRMM